MVQADFHQGELYSRQGRRQAKVTTGNASVRGTSVTLVKDIVHEDAYEDGVLVNTLKHVRTGPE